MAEIVIVGHGPSWKGKGWGSWIDEHVVCRMKDCRQLMDDYPKDIGKRTDYLCGSSDVIKRSMHTVLPKREGWAFLKSRKSQRPEPTASLKILDDVHRWNDRLKDAGGTHNNVSTGFAAIVGAIGAGFTHIHLIGFDSLIKGDEKKDVYSMNRGRSGHCKNDMQTEHRLFEELLVENKSLLVEVWL